MAISKNITITIKQTKASPGEKVFIYQGDFGVDFYFTLKQFNFEIKNEINITRELASGAYASATVLRPNGEIFERDPFPVTSEGYLKFTITKDFTDELSDIGEYKIQFHLFDGDGDEANRITIPPFTFEVKKLLE